MGAFVARATRASTLSQVRYVTPVPPSAARGLVADVYRQVEQEFGMLAPPISLHSGAPDVLAAAWTMLRESLIARDGADRATKEAVAAGVSDANSCPYCVSVHGATLRALGRTPDGDLREVTAWARGSGTPPAADRTELVAVAVTFQYLNRMVNVFLPDSPLPAAVPAVAAGGVQRVFRWALGSAARQDRRPGLALALLPEGAPGDHPAWAEDHPRLADAFGRAAHAIGAAGERSVPPAVRELVLTRLATWDGQPPGISAGWAAEAAAGLDPEDRPAGQLALLVALASYQVGPSIVEEFRQRHPDDRALVETAAWASLAAAARVGR